MNNELLYRPIEMIFSTTAKAIQIAHKDMFVWIPKSKVVFGKNPFGDDCFQVEQSVIENSIRLSKANGFNEKYIGG